MEGIQSLIVGWHPTRSYAHSSVVRQQVKPHKRIAHCYISNDANHCITFLTLFLPMKGFILDFSLTLTAFLCVCVRVCVRVHMCDVWLISD